MVEFEWTHKKHKGIVYLDTDGIRIVTRKERLVPRIEDCKDISYLAHVDIMDGITNCITAIDLAEKYFAEPYADRQQQWIEYHNLKVGDKVKVLRTAESYGDSWGNSWTDEMNGVIGGVFPISKITSDIQLNIPGICWYGFPYFVLEPVAETVEEFPELRPFSGVVCKPGQLFIATKNHWIVPAYMILMYGSGGKFHQAKKNGEEQIFTETSRENLLIAPFGRNPKRFEGSSSSIREAEADFKEKWPRKKLYVS